jgi:hypothetical protein
MHTIEATTHSKIKVTFSAIEFDYAKFIFNALKSCQDAETVLMYNGLTGEIEWEWTSNKGWVTVNGTALL